MRVTGLNKANHHFGGVPINCHPDRPHFPLSQISKELEIPLQSDPLVLRRES